MNFQHDLAEMTKSMIQSEGIKIPSDWEDSRVVIKYLELHHRWFDSSSPYLVVYSKELWKKLSFLSQDEQQALEDIERRLASCQTIVPYLSKDIRKISAKKSDFLLKNWDIYHLHLEQNIEGKKRKNPNLLFFQTKGQVVHMIDIKKHPSGPSWFDRDLLEIIFDNWPWLLKYQSKIKPIGKIDDSKMHKALQNMVVGIPFHGGTLFPTTMGVSSSGDSSYAVRVTFNIFNQLRQWEIHLKENEEAYKKEIINTMHMQIDKELDYKLIIEEGYFVAYEIHTQTKIKLFKAM